MRKWWKSVLLIQIIVNTIFSKYIINVTAYVFLAIIFFTTQLFNSLRFVDATLHVFISKIKRQILIILALISLSIKRNNLLTNSFYKKGLFVFDGIDFIFFAQILYTIVISLRLYLFSIYVLLLVFRYIIFFDQI